MKKRVTKSVALSMAFAILAVMPVMADDVAKKATTYTQALEYVSVDDSNATTEELRLFGKKKTIKKTYHSIAEIPESIYYEVYINGAWYGGDLAWTGESKLIAGTSLYEAIFKGTLSKL